MRCRGWVLPLLGLAFAGFPSLAWSQKMETHPFENARILVQVRYGDGMVPAQGIMVSLEGSMGEIINQCMTDAGGKCTFVPRFPAVYTVSVRQPGFREARQSVDLTISQTGFVSAELYPLPGTGRPAAPPGESGITISATELAIPEKARKEFDEGRKLLLDQKDIQGSIPHLQKAIKIYDAFAQAYTLLGVAYLAQQDWKSAQTVLEKAVRLDSHSGAAYLELGAALNQQKNYEAAEKALSRGLELDPNAPEGHYEIAKTYWKLGRWQEAEPHARKAAAIQPELAPVHVLLGDILLRKRDLQGALKEFQEYLRLAPGGSMAEPTRKLVAKLETALPKR